MARRSARRATGPASSDTRALLMPLQPIVLTATYYQDLDCLVRSGLYGSKQYDVAARLLELGIGSAMREARARLEDREAVSRLIKETP
jgi:hypothetical protein